MKMNYVGPSYIFSKHDRFMCLLATINGEVIEQMFHVSHLKKGLLRLPNGRTAKTISDYKLEMIRSTNDTKGKDDTKDLGTSNSSQTCVKTVFHSNMDHEQITHRKLQNSECWYEHPSTLQHVCVGNKDKLPYLYHAHPRRTYY